MREIVKNTIINHRLLDKDDNIVIGVSGGHDSMTLLYVLESLKAELNFSIHVAHINHGVRGSESDGDEDYVKNICKNLNVPFYSHKTNMDEYAKKHKLTSEEAGREIRYSFFRKSIKKLGGGKIAVAHNKNDQAETLIMRFIRGTGIDGLRGMEYKNGDIIRPLLDIDRIYIEKYCDDNGIIPRIDKTNFQPIYGRNKVRLELIPYIQKTFNKGIIDTLSRTSTIMKNDSDFLQEYTEDRYREILEKEDKSKIHLNIEKLHSLHQSIKTRVIRYAIERIHGSIKGLEEKHIKDILNLVSSKITGKKINIINNIVVKISYNNLIIEKSEKVEDIRYNYKLDVNSTINILELGSSIKSKVTSVSSIKIDENNDFIKYFDYDKVKDNLYIRNRIDGDKFRPIGMKGNKKLKDFFIDEKVPRDYRNTIPLVVDEEDILWIVGLRISENYKITSNTKNILVLEYIQ
ncbi:tRNA(Ile)-lysidine synthase [Gottschalkia acidurici 9a]|uniref:tRNA(Ile)-lysidine synthase n=1 Tax=Gottschalkia acidurici (strain ATCC 7906 / DSM 604 / BCRC 14475 / CIP 104303 / KCTC 5404 / NCIMB 10678 / 9a) TaxID=1128398 RepID=K0B1K9_GOTA9|nr:tRNA lysidine(34) synthetase TilS [Gottschalkia acidurici]AFS79364.1 tRNA(Ile)-lysidine synthase [Gottschalkia acidurici 9a]